MIDLPAPVSPVSAVRPGPIDRSRLSISTTSRMARPISMGRRMAENLRRLKGPGRHGRSRSSSAGAGVAGGGRPASRRASSATCRRRRLVGRRRRRSCVLARCRTNGRCGQAGAAPRRRARPAAALGGQQPVGVAVPASPGIVVAQHRAVAAWPRRPGRGSDRPPPAGRAPRACGGWSGSVSTTVLNRPMAAIGLPFAQIPAADGHFLAGQLVVDHVDLQPGVGGVFGVRDSARTTSRRAASACSVAAWSRPTSTICSK